MGLYDLLLASNINGGSGKVVANPDEPAIAELEKLKVGDSVYSVVTKAVNDLANYYTKSDVYTKTEVNNIAQARFQVVAELPSSDIQTNVIYLVPKSTEQTNNDYDEYIYALKSTNPETYGWEKIGDTEIDLSGYVTTSDLNTALADYTTTADLTTLLAGKQNALTFDSTPTAQSTNPVTSGGIKTYVDEQGAKTVSGSPITITDAEGMNADHVTATITPAQTGSGTPSPSNVRPLVGFSSVDISVADAPNYADINQFTTGSPDNVTISVDGKDLVLNGHASSYSYVAAYEEIAIPNGEYWIVADVIAAYAGVKWSCTIMDSDNSSVIWSTGDTTTNLSIKQKITVNNNKIYLRFYPLRGTTSGIIRVKNLRISSTLNYKDCSIQLGNTYYGGTLDVTSGKLTITDGHIASYNGETLPSTWLSDRDEYAEGTTPTTGAEVVYKLATPIEIQLTPTQIELLENNNTITTNVSSLDITYQANTAIGDTASALDKRVTSLESKVPNPPTTDGTYKLTVTVASGTPTYSWESAI